jgi:leucyl aminopeptidase
VLPSTGRKASEHRRTVPSITAQVKKMEFPVRTGAPSKQRTACAIVPLFEDRTTFGVAKRFDVGGAIGKLVRAGDVSCRLGSTVFLPTKKGAADRLLLVGCGKRAQFDGKRLMIAVGAAVQALKGTKVREVISYLTYQHDSLDAYYAARFTVEASRGALYRFDELKSLPDSKPRLARMAVALGDNAEAEEARRGIAHGQAIAAGMDLARDLGNRPANVCTPSHLAATARELAQRHRRLRAEVLDGSDIERLGMGAFLAVTRGAVEPPQLIVLEYKGAGDRVAPVVLCGKGVTFDTGGISLKPPPKMDEMKFDMCGAAGVLGTMAAVAELEPPLNVVAIVPACENMPSGQASRPGDIVTCMSGQTVEILNTDAEGRLILCDALTYAQRYKPRLLIDVATLTGACVVALGHVYTGLFSSDEDLSAELLAAGRRSLDGVWRLPLDEEYGDALKSNFADFANAGTRDGGASIAANFLSRFAPGQRWAHLDIAGVAFRSDANKGATGRPVPLLMDFLLNSPLLK